MFGSISKMIEFVETDSNKDRIREAEGTFLDMASKVKGISVRRTTKPHRYRVDISVISLNAKELAKIKEYDVPGMRINISNPDCIVVE